MPINTKQENKQETLRLYLREIGKKPLLTAEDEKKLARRIQKGDEQARREFLEANLRLVVYVAKRYAPGNNPDALLDLIQEGNLGLFRAVERYNPKFKTRFSTYAVYWIKQAIQRSMARDRTIRLPENIVEDVKRMRRVRHRLYQKLGRQPTEEELARSMRVPVATVLRLENVSQAIVSIDQPVGNDEEEGTELGDLIVDLEQPQPEFIVNQNLLRGQIRSIIKTLPVRHQELVKLRFGLDGHTPMTLSEIGQKFGISRERVRQLQEEALEKLRSQKDIATRLQ